MLTVDPPKPVTVEQSDGTWPGWLSAWRRTDSGWRAFVQNRRGPGMGYVHCVEATYVVWLEAVERFRGVRPTRLELAATVTG